MKRPLITCAAAAAFAIGAGSAHAVSYFDGTFDNGDWTSLKLLDTTDGALASHTSQQVNSNGNPGSLRQTTHDWTIKTAGVSILFAHMRDGFTFDPGAAGIDNLQLSFDYRMPTSIFWVGSIGMGPLIEQGGTYYTSRGASLLAPQPWTPFVFDLTDPGVWGATDGSGQPDFGANAAPISFGYFTSNGGSGGNRNLTATGQIDNFAVTVTPEPGTLALLAVGVAVSARRRQRG